MNFTPLQLVGAWRITLDRHEDSRGAFSRIFCCSEFAEHGLETEIKQSNISFNHKAGTLRGLHFQKPPHSETKLVRCSRGRIWDVIVDVRDGSETYGQWHGEELDPDNGSMLYIPAGFAHGFQTLCDSSEVLYAMFDVYAPDSATGIRWNDASLDITWRLPPTVISEQDAQLPLLKDTAPYLRTPDD